MYRVCCADRPPTIPYLNITQTGPQKIARTPRSVSRGHLPSLAFSSTVLATMFSSSIKRKKRKSWVCKRVTQAMCSVAERGGGGKRPSACALRGWTGGAGVSFTPRRCMSGLHLYQSRGVWNRMSHIRLQGKLGMLPVVGDAFLLQFLSTQNHSMRKLKKKKVWVTESLRRVKKSRASRCQTIAERAPLDWILPAESTGSWPLLHDCGGGWLAERCTQRTSAPTPFFPPR